MPIVRERDAVRHDLHGVTFNAFVSPASGSRELCAWRLEVAAGSVGMPHRVSKEEIVVVLAGRLTATIDGAAAELSAGEVAFVPAGATFSIDNPSAEPASAWVTTSVGLTATLSDGTEISPPWAR
jgi:quercetin dioxygenase-like cupin family protein